MRRLLPTRLAAAAAALAVVVAPAAYFAAAAASQSAFTPAALAGNWVGTWTNTTFGSTGPASMTVKSIKVAPKKVKRKVRVRGKLVTKTKLVPRPPKLSFVSDFGGNVFGCTDPAAEAKTITKGNGPNHWNAAGFEIEGSASRAFGALRIVYDHAARTLTGAGGDPPCAPGLKWTLSGSFPDATHFTGTVQITLPNGRQATSVLALARG